MFPGPFADAKRWDEQKGEYEGLVIEGSIATSVVIDSEAVIIRPAIALEHNRETAIDQREDKGVHSEREHDDSGDIGPVSKPLPTR